MLCPPFVTPPVVTRWIERHRHPISFLLHMIGIPPTIIAVLILPIALPILSWRIFLLSVALFVGGYLIQFLGHVVDWTEPGELKAIRRLFRGRNAEPGRVA